MIAKFKAELGEHFQVKDLGELHYFLEVRKCETEFQNWKDMDCSIILYAWNGKL